LKGAARFAELVTGMESKDWISWLGIGLAVVLVFEIFAAIAAATAPIGGYYGMMGGGAWGWGILMMVVPALVLIVILVALLGGLRGPAPAIFYPAYAPAAGNALDALGQRYVRGELNPEDYLRIRGDLTHGSSES
jgi:uncharacterized membrane protein